MRHFNHICILILFHTFFTAGRLFANDGFLGVAENLNSRSLIINNNDSILFNLNNATLTANYIDIPVCIKSDDAIFAVDFAFQFNLSKLTYSTCTSTLNDPTLSFSAYFNPSDLFLRYSGFTLQSFPNNGLVCFTKVRFMLSAPCTSLTIADFSNGSSQLNGQVCPFRFVQLDNTQLTPLADFGFAAPCLDVFTIFSDSSKVGKGNIVSWSWQFGDGSVASLENTIKTFTIAGANTATLLVTASSGCTNSIVKGFTVNARPIAGFTYTLDCLKDTVFFTNTSSTSSGILIGSSWYFGDGTPLSQVFNPAHKYFSSGTFKVKLTVTATTGCHSSVTQDFQIRPTDFNKDGMTDINDYLIFLPLYNTTCTN
jgi:hypothetical protein